MKTIYAMKMLTSRFLSGVSIETASVSTKITLLLFIAVAITQNLNAQIYMFQKTYGGTGTDRCFSTFATSDGGFIMAGETDSYGAGSYDGYLVKTDAQGIVLWAKSYGTVDWDWFNSVQQTSDGGYIVTGGTENSTSGQGDILIIKTDASGNIVWQKQAGDAGYDNGYDVRQTNDNGFIVSGFQYGDAVSTDNACLIKLDYFGTVQWTRTYSAGFDEYGYTVEQTADGGYIMGGESYVSPGDVALIIKTDPNGIVQWAKTYGGGSDYWVVRILKDATGNYFVAGTASDPNYLNVWLAKLNPNGTPVWSNTYAGAGTLEDNCIWATRNSDGSFALCGGSNSFVTDYEAFILKVDSAGGPVWSKRYGGNSNDNASQLVQTSDGGYVVGCNTLSFGSGASIYLVKTDAFGTSTCNENIPAFITNSVTTAAAVATINDSAVTNSITSSLVASAQTFTEATLCLTVGEEEIEIGKNEIVLYPNPATNQFTIHDLRFTIERVDVFDVLGKRVYSMPQTTTNKPQTIDISTLTNGIYFVRVRTEKGDVIKKLIKE